MASYYTIFDREQQSNGVVLFADKR